MLSCGHCGQPVITVSCTDIYSDMDTWKYFDSAIFKIAHRNCGHCGQLVISSDSPFNISFKDRCEQ